MDNSVTNESGAREPLSVGTYSAKVYQLRDISRFLDQMTWTLGEYQWRYLHDKATMHHISLRKRELIQKYGRKIKRPESRIVPASKTFQDMCYALSSLKEHVMTHELNVPSDLVEFRWIIALVNVLQSSTNTIPFLHGADVPCWMSIRIIALGRCTNNKHYTDRYSSLSVHSNSIH
jgi:hypothetical protein